MTTSCSKQSNEAVLQSDQELPDMVLSDATYVVSQDSDSPLVMKAKTITVYGSGQDTTMQNVSFSQGDKLSGSCETAVVNQKNDSATLNGNITLTQKEGDEVVTILGQNMSWDGESQTFVCEGEVEVHYSDGTMIRAVGFLANAGENLYEFAQILEGTTEK